MVLNVIMSPLRGKIAITQPFLDRFWIFLAQMNTQVSLLDPCGSQWNHTTSQWKNSCNSAISWPILDLFDKKNYLIITHLDAVFFREMVLSTLTEVCIATKTSSYLRLIVFGDDHTFWGSHYCGEIVLTTLSKTCIGTKTSSVTFKLF